MSAQFKTCPFCGSGNTDENPIALTMEENDIPILVHTQRFVRCNECGAQGSLRATKREAANAWNTRHPNVAPGFDQELAQ